ncbi:MAG: tRNA (adenosine(37)-N6)-dimethylallyltransferase MiaA [Flavobacteriales bacterium]|nr:tRNA (adenosine(37)-N6)-dimethylallyltransferase MiaA [Flavobacteriales bacterium]
MKKKLVVILGPTAIGKTKLSIKLAKHFKSEIISCDSRQFYKELNIGTAPPSKAQLNQVRHHFIQDRSINSEFNAGMFENEAINLIESNNNKILFAVGGSGLYINAICKGLDNIPIVPKDIRNKLTYEYKKNGILWLQKQIKKIDENYEIKYDINNPQRMLRFIEVYYFTGKSIEYFKMNKTKKRNFDIIKIGLFIDRIKLYKKINSRVDLMIENGLINEVESLINHKDKNALQTVGYKEIFKYFDKEYTLDVAIEKIKQNTRNFAKRQITWFKKDQDINWFKTVQIKEILEFIEAN